MAYPSDLTDAQWDLLEPVFNTPGKRSRRHGEDLRVVVDAMLYIVQTGCQWRYLPESFGPWTRVWSQFRRWSRNGTWARAQTVLHAAAREADGRTEGAPSMVVIDTHLARGASNGGLTFHDRGGPYGRTKGAKRVVAVDVTGLPVGALVVPASMHENRVSELMLQHLDRQGVTGRLELVLVDRGVTEAAARTLGQHHEIEVRRVGWDDKRPVLRPIRHAWRVEVAHGRLGRSRRQAKSFENTTNLGDRLAPGRLHRDYAAPLVSRTGSPAQNRGLSDRQLGREVAPGGKSGGAGATESGWLLNAPLTRCDSARQAWQGAVVHPACCRVDGGDHGGWLWGAPRRV